jgi:hypothetical protein
MFEITKIGNVLDRVKTPADIGRPRHPCSLWNLQSNSKELGIFPQLPAAFAFTLLQAIVRYNFLAGFGRSHTRCRQLPSLLNSSELKFCLSAVGIFGFLAFESSREALKDRSEDEVLQDDGGR